MGASASSRLESAHASGQWHCAGGELPSWCLPADSTQHQPVSLWWTLTLALLVAARFLHNEAEHLAVWFPDRLSKGDFMSSPPGMAATWICCHSDGHEMAVLFLTQLCPAPSVVDVLLASAFILLAFVFLCVESGLQARRSAASRFPPRLKRLYFLKEGLCLFTCLVWHLFGLS